MAKEIDAKRIMNDFKRAYEAKKKSLKLFETDFEFTLGKQWDDGDVTELRSVGVKALTLNKIRPIVWLLTGIESQNRSDYLAFPEGEEDSLTAEVVTRLLKNVLKKTEGHYKISEAFEDCTTCGESYIEPYIDYTYDLLNGEMKLKKVNYDQVFNDPASVEYDCSDGEFQIKFTPGLTKDQVLGLFPDKESIINNLESSGSRIDLINFSNLKTLVTGVSHVQSLDYPSGNDDNANPGDLTYREQNYDLIEYYYKKYVKKYFVADLKLGTLRESANKAEAMKYAEIISATKNPDDPTDIVRVIERVVPEIWVSSMIGNEQIENVRSQFYPRWRSFPLIPFYCYRSTAPIKNREYKVQGIARGLISPQEEHNKRRTQELRLLNSSANSGWLTEEDAWVDKDKVEKFGSAPGINLEYKQGRTKPERITPTPLSQGHAQLALEHNNDIKEISGINTEALAINDKDQSGRAIYLRQKQSLLIVQKLFDNLSQSKRLLGRFILSQLGQIYDLDLAGKVLGEGFLREHFERPVTEQRVNSATGQKETMPVMDETGQMKMEMDNRGIGEFLNMILNDAGIGKYDVAIGEGANNETIKFANYMTLMDMAGKGVPIPPDVLVDESMLSTGHKQKIIRAIEKQQQAQAKAQAAAAGQPAR